MKALIVGVACLWCSLSAHSQINFTANDFGHTPAYNGYFHYGTNMGYYGPSWDDNSLSDIAAGNSSRGVAGVGSKSLRIMLPEYFVEYYGYDVRLAEFNHYSSLGIQDNTIFVGSPSEAHRDSTMFGGCGQYSYMFKNLFDPIWDGGANGTPINDNNYYALYIYKLVQRYKSNTKFWEIVNEPDYTWSSAAWYDPGMPGNWWENNPSACQLNNLFAPIFYYIRMLRISYEVIKYLDPSAYIAIGGIGYPSFLDAVLRNTDNPADGSVTAEYPLKGGAYFDVLSFHNYPMYSLRYWDNSINNFAYKRHSDGAAEEYIKKKNSFVNVLNTYGYDDLSYPKKLFICTENNIPKKEFGDYIGTDEAQKNYILKALVENQMNDIRQYYVFVLGDSKTYAEATNPYEMMGLYQKLEGIGPLGNGGAYLQQYTNEGVAFKTCSDLLHYFRYEPVRSLALNLAPNIGGGAFRDSIGSYVYVLWAKTTIDKSELASATYSFPASLSLAPMLNKREWNYSVTSSTTSIPSVNIGLTASPVFLSDNFQLVPLRDPIQPPRNEEKKFALSVYPNPASSQASLKFTLTSPTRVQVKVFNAAGICVLNTGQPQTFATGTYVLPLPSFQQLPSGLYDCRFETEMIRINRKLVITR